MDSILELKNITKKYDKKIVVDRVNLSVKKGRIYGLIGPNGAGKTTIMKMIAGLCKQDDGIIEVFGDSNNLDEKRSKMSFMIETPYLETSMTAIQNMEYIARLRGIKDKKRINEVLKFVGLEQAGSKKVDKFSLGMKQRLGIGMSLLPDPEIMILDEPVNGLDPEGIVDVRNMLVDMVKNQNITVIISSHLLSELSELCTDFAIINEGKVIECISKEDLVERCARYLTIKTNDILVTKKAIFDNLKVGKMILAENDELMLFDYEDDLQIISKFITDKGFIITKFVEQGESLEKYYLSKVGEKND